MFRWHLFFKRKQQPSSTVLPRWRFVLTVVFAILVFTTLVPMRVSAAVEVTNFAATGQTTQIAVNWKTATEVQIAAFNLQRGASKNGPFANVKTFPANVGSITGRDYSYNDTNVVAGQEYFYRLQTIRPGGSPDPQFNGPVSASLPASTATPTNTRAPTSAPAATQTPTSTPVNALTTTPTPSPTAIALPSPSGAPSLAVAGSAPSPTRVAKVAQAVATPAQNGGTTTENQDVPTPGLTLVAIGIKQITPEPDVSSTEAETDTPTVDSTSIRSYYLVRLISAGLLLSAASLAFGALVLGTLAAYFFLRANLR